MTEELNKYYQGKVLDGTVFQKENYGIYVKINEVDFGLIRIIDYSDDLISMNELPDIGAKIQCVVLFAEKKEKDWKIILSSKKSEIIKSQKCEN